MDIILAQNAGACYGVQRALDLAIDASQECERAYTFGPLIHNPGVVSDLEARGVFVAISLDDIDEGIVIIRSHGVTPEELGRLKAMEDVNEKVLSENSKLRRAVLGRDDITAEDIGFAMAHTVNV